MCDCLRSLKKSTGYPLFSVEGGAIYTYLWMIHEGRMSVHDCDPLCMVVYATAVYCGSTHGDSDGDVCLALGTDVGMCISLFP